MKPRKGKRNRSLARRPDLRSQCHLPRDTEPTVTSGGERPSSEDIARFAIPGFEMLRQGRFAEYHCTLTSEEHSAWLEQLAKSRPRLLEEIEQLSHRAESLLRSHNTLDMLVTLLLFEQSIDPETYKEADNKGKAAIVEYAALLAIKWPLNEELTHPANGSLPVTELRELIDDILRYTSWYYLTESLARGERDPDVLTELRIFSIMEGIFVRGAGYPHHLKEVIGQLFSVHDEWMLATLGFTVDDAIRTLESLARGPLDALGERFHQARQHESRLTKAVKDASAGVPVDSEYQSLVDQFRTVPAKERDEHIRMMTRAWAIFDLGEQFLQTAEVIASRTGISVSRTKAVLDAFSCQVGDVPSDFHLPQPEHPLLTRPAIKHDSRYIAVHRDHLSGIQRRLESLLNPQSAEARNKCQESWELYQRHRARSTEAIAIRLLGRIMPGAAVHSNLEYVATGAAHGKLCELDGLVLFDCNVLLVEVRAGSLDASSRRGSPIRIERDVKELLGKPDQQTARAEEFIQSNDKPTFRTKDGGTVIIDKRSVRHIHRIVVTLSQLAVFTTAMYRTAELNIFVNQRLPWCVSLMDLMIIADFIRFPSQFVHYLRRRIRLNELGRTYAHDEIDLFGHYLSEGLYFEQLGELDMLQLLGYSSQFDDYYFHEQGLRRTPAPVPSMKLPANVTQLIEELEATGKWGRSEIVCRLLDLSSETREEFDRFIDETRRRVRRDGRTHDATIMLGDGSGGVTFFATKPAFADAARERLPRYMVAKRAQTGAKEWIGFLSIVGQRHLIETFVFLADK